MRRSIALPLALLCALAACDKPKGIFADRTVSVVAPAAAAEATPRFVGRWAASVAQCEHPWVIEARSLKAASSNCDFDKVSSNSAGYTVTAICHTGAEMTPTRLSIITPAEAKISMLTIQGGPFKDAVPLERCSAS